MELDTYFDTTDLSDTLANNASIIKVVGVGGGGSNAVNHMFNRGIKDVTFVVCNTDQQALQHSPVSQQIILGDDGLGAGGRPENAASAVSKSLTKIEKMLTDTPTKMVFITAGMGGGTGTGAAPIIAKVAHDLGILTVGVVTIPYAFEGKLKINQALRGVLEMSKNVDAILVVNNEKLCEIYPDLDMLHSFEVADEVLTTAVKSIAEIITVHGYMNIDFADVNTIMKDSGIAIMNIGVGEGENRVMDAINNALKSPLLENTDVRNSKRILLNISCSSEKGILGREVTQVREFMEQMIDDVNVITGVSFDDSLGEKVKITIIATGFTSEALPKAAPKQNSNGNTTAEDRKKEGLEIDRSRSEYYGNTVPGENKNRNERPVLPDLDDDKVLAEIQNTPAYQRI